ncbi:hypothetical protein [Lysinibacillus piscis]|uniref:Lipoprotein YdaJ n=1 Tax=Lysinibacillus piscis TaxID=2518931 RepID=A0ABQ5NJQ8_9BACI|nr:hypothetical protein [Lysinibacillus sp. KH24]GLC88606.1 putative lipoprotein YdaJ [Lysinibacillus sp. KH24]
MKKSIFIVVMVCLLVGCSKQEALSQKKPLSSTEQFVIQELMNDQGLLATDLTEQNDLYLSESVGLWLDYLLEKDDQGRFDEQVSVLEDHFLQKNFIVWQIDGQQAATVNALIDDLRIIQALFVAGDKWNEPSYTKLATKIGKNLAKYGMKDDVFVDFVDVISHDKASVLTMCYIMPIALKNLQSHQLISKKQLNKQLTILRNAPLQKGYFPKYYDVQSKKYVFDKELHMIDQLYTAYHMSTLDRETTVFRKWLLQHYRRDGKLYGRYDANTDQPAVDYESPAVYAMAARYMLAIGERNLAEQFLQKMETLRVNKGTGYVDKQTQATHIFDNLLPLLAEREVKNAESDELE